MDWYDRQSDNRRLHQHYPLKTHPSISICIVHAGRQVKQRVVFAIVFPPGPPGPDNRHVKHIPGLAEVAECFADRLVIDASLLAPLLRRVH